MPDNTGLSSSNGTRTETAESRFIRLLTFLSQADCPFSSDKTTPLSDILALAELRAGGFISGEVGRDGLGHVGYISHAEILPSGRAYLAELKRQAEAQTSFGLIKQKRFHFYHWFFVIVGAIISGYIVWRLTH